MVVLHIRQQIRLVFLENFVLDHPVTILNEPLVDASLVRELYTLNLNGCHVCKLFGDFQLKNLNLV